MEEKNMHDNMAANRSEDGIGTNSARQHFSKLGWSFLIGSIVIRVVQFLVSYFVGMWRPEWLQNTNINLVLSSSTMYLIGMPIMCYFVKRVPAEKIARKSMRTGHFLLALLMCYPIMYCSNLVGVILTAIIGVLKGSPVNNQIFDVVADANIWIILLYMVILAPILEELIFRKLIVDRAVRYGQGVAIVVSGLMFGLFHGNLNQFVYATTLGMFLAFLYVKTGDVRVTIGVHMVVNFFGGLVSTLLLKAIHYEEFTELVYGGGTPQQLMRFYMTYLPGWILYMLYAVLVLTVVITGIVLLILFRKRFVLEPGEVVLPAGRQFQIVFGNLGMLVFILFWIGTIIIQLFFG